MSTDGIWLKAVFYRPVIGYATGAIGFLSMFCRMVMRIILLAALLAAAFGSVAYDQGVFEQDGNRPEPVLKAS